MSVPLDRLYNFLHGLCNQDIIIYRWFPHGSRKLEDCTPICNIDVLLIDQLHSSTYLVAHDQEPLTFNDWPKVFDVFKMPGHDYSRLKAVLPKLIFQDKILLAHSEKNSKELELFEKDGAVGVYWWSHGLIARDWYRYAELDPSLQIKNPNIPFLIYNRAWQGTREYRLKFAEMLVENNLTTHCNMGFNAVDGIDYRQHKFANQNFKIESTDLENYFFNNQTSAEASADYCSHDYQQSNLEVVLETLFDDSRLHLTEKTLRPIACGQPFILCSTPGSLLYLKQYGFETFDSLWDESYDNIIDPMQRLEAIVDLMKTLATKDKKFFEQANAIAQRNKNHFFSKKFLDQVIDEFRINFDSARSQISHSGAYFKRVADNHINTPGWALYSSEELDLLLSTLSAESILK